MDHLFYDYVPRCSDPCFGSFGVEMPRNLGLVPLPPCEGSFGRIASKCLLSLIFLWLNVFPSPSSQVRIRPVAGRLHALGGNGHKRAYLSRRADSRISKRCKFHGRCKTQTCPMAGIFEDAASLSVSISIAARRRPPLTTARPGLLQSCSAAS